MSNVRPQFQSRTGARRRAFACTSLAVILLAACQNSAAPANTALLATAVARPNLEQRPVAGGPLLLREQVKLRKVADVGSGNIKLARSPLDGDLYYLTTGAGLFRVAIDGSTKPTLAASAAEIAAGANAAGMAFGPDGALYVVSNKPIKPQTQAQVRKGVPTAEGTFAWHTLLTTEPYPASNTQFDHLWNGIVISPDNTWMYVNAGSRTDHGEVQHSNGDFPNTREIALTTKIFRVPTDAAELVLPNDEAKLDAGGYIFARGTRNAYDLAFAPNGDLFAVDNGPDADYADELNWIRQGQHYGFPWKFGDQDNPQQFINYDSSADKRLNQDFQAVKNGSYANDPSFPTAPGTFTNPVLNLGPDAAIARADDGSEFDAAATGVPLATFTPHRSPLGLVFGGEGLPADLRGDGETQSAFVLSWGAAGGTLSDKGQDLVHMALRKQGDNYESVTTQIASDLKYPIDAVLENNKLYVLEYGEGGALWELTFD
ncbi:MAG: PQQ-dependent sugar dehydrogenase [Roseiflexaceae bacterium]|nr:PQQ-dependent sugar dehydrogenase [Roseiflexaceae bacterium]